MPELAPVTMATLLVSANIFCDPLPCAGRCRHGLRRRRSRGRRHPKPAGASRPARSRRGAKRQAPSQTAQGWHRLFASGTSRPSDDLSASVPTEAGPCGNIRCLPSPARRCAATRAGRSNGPRPSRKQEYDVIIVGAGGHGLATAYYLAKEHGITNVAVLEKGWLGGGNTGRNTTIIRSNYLYDESAGIYDHAREAVGRAQPGPQLQRHVFAARRHDAGAQRPRRPGAEAPHPCQPAERHRQ